MILNKSEILATIGSVTILRDGRRVATREVRTVLFRCESCSLQITDPREVPFCKQSGMCYQCCTGSVLDFCHRSVCRTVRTSQVSEGKRRLTLLTPETGEFRTQLWYGDPSGRWTELHWSYEPWEGFLRVGYDIFRVLHDLTVAEIHASMHNAIYKGVRANAILTRPRWLEVCNERKHRGHHNSGTRR